MSIHFELIDGETDPKYLNRKPSELATDFIHKLGKFARTSLEINQDHQPPQSYRMGSWVVEAESELGYALAISKVKPIPHTIDGYTALTKFHTVRRDTDSPALVEKPKDFSIDNSVDIRDQIIKAFDTFDRNELIYGISIIEKMSALALKEDYHSIELDGKVFQGILEDEENLRYLAENHPTL